MSDIVEHTYLNASKRVLLLCKRLYLNAPEMHLVQILCGIFIPIQQNTFETGLRIPAIICNALIRNVIETPNGSNFLLNSDSMALVRSLYVPVGTIKDKSITINQLEGHVCLYFTTFYWSISFKVICKINCMVNSSIVSHFK